MDGNISSISQMGISQESHLASWFERYHRLNLNMYLTQGGRAYHHIQRYFSPCSENYKKEFHIWMEISLQYLKWVFHGISFCCLVYEISLFEATHVCNQRGPHALQIQASFSHSMGHLRTSSIYDGNISSVAQMGLRRNWISSPVAEVMNIFAEGCSQPPKSRFFHIIF
jgi:hypothetical protein